MKNETLEFETSNGSTSAYVAMPDEITSDTKPLIIIHEWWGLNDYIKSVIDRYAEEGFIAIGPDLYRGKIASNPEDAAEMMGALETEDGLDTIRHAIRAAGEKYGRSEFGITGYCMGGTFALQAACNIDGLKASAPYYGDVPDDETLAKCGIPVVFVSGTRDEWITPEKVAGLESAAEKHDLNVTSLKYDSDHAFTNASRPEVYDKEAAEDAWTKVVTFLKESI